MDIVVQAPYLAPDDVDALVTLTDAAGVEPLSRATNDAVRLYNVTAAEGVTEACAAAGYDVAFIAVPRAATAVRLVAMDMDSTLITIECVDEIAGLAGIKPEVAAITAAAMRGEIDFAESLRRRVQLLAGLPVSVLATVYDEKLRLSPGAESMIAAFHAFGAETLLVSGGFTYFTERLQQRLGLAGTLSNTLQVADGRLTGALEGPIVDAEAKAAALRERAHAVHGANGVVLAIGDGANDLPMLAAADVSVAYHAKPVVRKAATYAIDHCGLDAVLNLFD
jgi:phosphoserine phosphatase